MNENNSSESSKNNSPIIKATNYGSSSDDCCYIRPRRGQRGLIGPIGPMGPIGPAGSIGPAGPTGAAGNGTIIPFATGVPITLITLASGLAETQFATGFGSSTIIAVVANTIDTSAIIDLPTFSMPRNGIITGLSAFFNATSALTLLTSTVTIRAQLYQSTAPNNIYSAIPDAFVDLAPSYTGTLAIGAMSYGNKALNIPVSLGTRLLLVFSSSATGAVLITSVIGYGSGGLAIS